MSNICSGKFVRVWNERKTAVTMKIFFDLRVIRSHNALSPMLWQTPRFQRRSSTMAAFAAKKVDDSTFNGSLRVTNLSPSGIDPTATQKRMTFNEIPFRYGGIPQVFKVSVTAKLFVIVLTSC